MAETLEQLRNLREEELVRLHDQRAKRTEVGTAHYLQELARRDSQELNRTMVRLTWVITFLTAVNVAATIAGVLVALR